MAKQLQKQIRQKKLYAKCLLTDMIRKFAKMNKTPTKASDIRSTEIEITGLPKPPPLFAGAGREPAWEHQDQLPNQIRQIHIRLNTAKINKTSWLKTQLWDQLKVKQLIHD